jgi:hypothetical protein
MPNSTPRPQRAPHGKNIASRCKPQQEQGTPHSIDVQLRAATALIERAQNDAERIIAIEPAKLLGHEFIRAYYGEFNERLEECKRRLQYPVFRIATLGTTTAGKSTFVNALIGRRIAPLSMAEMSAGILTIRHAECMPTVTIEETEEAAWPTGNWNPNPGVAVTDGEIYSLIRDQIMKPYQRLRASRKLAMPMVRIEAPLALGRTRKLLGLPDVVGMEVVDLPGLNSTDSEDTNLRLIQNQLGQAFTVMVLDYSQTDPRRREILLNEIGDIIATMGGRDDAIMFVLNKFDLRDSADTDRDIEERIDDLRHEIKLRLDLTDLPAIVPLNSRIWMLAQCAWGVDLPSENPTTSEGERRDRLAELKHDCSNDLERLSETYPEIARWWEDSRKRWRELDCTDLRYLLTEIVLPFSGAQQFMKHLSERLREHCTQLIIQPALYPVIVSYNRFLTTVAELSRAQCLETKEEIQEAISRTRSHVLGINQFLDDEQRAFSTELTQIAKGIAAGSTGEVHESAVKLMREKYSALYSTLDGFLSQASGELVESIAIPLQKAARRVEGGDGDTALFESLKNKIPESLARAIDEAYAKYRQVTRGFEMRDGGFIRLVPKDEQLAEVLPFVVEDTVNTLAERILESIETRAKYFLQERAAIVRELLTSMLLELNDRILERAMEVSDNSKDVAEVIEGLSAFEYDRAIVLPENIFTLSFDAEHQDVEAFVPRTKIVYGQRRWYTLWLWRSRKTIAFSERELYVEIETDSPGGLAQKASDACENALSDLLFALIRWIDDALRAQVAIVKSSFGRLSVAIEAELDRMLKIGVEDLKREIRVWKTIGREVNGCKQGLVELTHCAGGSI